jgi:hypothetical protein
MDAEELKREVRAGRIGVDRLVDLVVMLLDRVSELEKKLSEAESRKLSEPYSLESEEKRRAARGKSKKKRPRPTRRGRVTTADKIKHAERTEKVFPAQVSADACFYSHTRPVWRLEAGRAVLIAYEIYRGPRNRFGKIPGVLGRSEFGFEIVLAIAYQVFIVGLSFDKVCLMFGFFQNLRLRKSQVDALLNQLSRHWEGEFERLCTLLANSAVVHTDETSWSLKSVWAFLSEKARLLLFGVNKDAATLEKILDPAVFAGIVVSDDAAVYANFTQAQKCWAHLLRKAIKLTLLEPANAEFRQFTDQLLEIYYTAQRVQSDARFSDAGRVRKVAELDDQIVALCAPMWVAELPKLDGANDDYRLLCNELMKLMLAQQLFTFVTAAPVATPTGKIVPIAGTNNESERTLRNPATARKTGRTNKTYAGARRQTIIVSVLESLRCFLPTFNVVTIIAEIQTWLDTGQSGFERLCEKLRLSAPATKRLDNLFPDPT